MRNAPPLLQKRPASPWGRGRPIVPDVVRRAVLARNPQLLGFSILPSGVIQDALDASFTNWDSDIHLPGPKFFWIGEVLAYFRTRDIMDAAAVKAAANALVQKNKGTFRDWYILITMMRDIKREDFPSAYDMVHGQGSIGITSGITGSIAQAAHAVATGAVNVAKETASDAMDLARSAADTALNLGPWYMKPKIILPLLLVGLGFFYWDKVKGLLPKNPAIKYLQNPIPKRAAQAAKLYETFTEHTATRRRPIPAIDTSELAELGTALELGYKSDKWTGKRQNYLHEFSKGVRMYATADGRALVLTGGKMKLTARGIEN